MSRSLVGSLGLAFLSTLAVWAPAQVQWYEHYQRGLELEEQQGWGQAAREFEAAIRVKPRPRKQIATYGRNTIFNYDPHFHAARCLIELERYQAAAALLRTSARAGVTPIQQLKTLRDRLEAGRRQGHPQPRTVPRGHLVVTGEPRGTQVFLDGNLLGTTPLGPVPVGPGEHVVRLSARGFDAQEHRIRVEPGATFNLAMELHETPSSPPPTPVPSRTSTLVVPTLAPRAIPTVQAASGVPGPRATPAAVTPTGAPTAPGSAVASPSAAPSTSSPDRQPPAAGATRLPWLQSKGLLGWALVVVLAGLIALALWLLMRRRRPQRPTEETSSLDLAPTVVKSGSTIGQYTLTGILGRGGMATTYRAHHGADGTPVAIKIPHESCLADPSYVLRFLREGRLGEQLHHPRIVRIFEAGEESGRPYLAMELLAGMTLKDYLRSQGPLPVRRALQVAADIAEALDYAHVKGVIHRDLKPENVMVLSDNTLKVMDFGIARLEGQEGLTSSQFFLGTPLYAAPEMIDPKSIDHRVDLYSLGIILFEMLQGTVPFSADSPFKVLQMHQREALPQLGQLHQPVPDEVWGVVVRLCAKRPEQRYATAEGLLVELHALLRDYSRKEDSAV